MVDQWSGGGQSFLSVLEKLQMFGAGLQNSSVLHICSLCSSGESFRGPEKD